MNLTGRDLAQTDRIAVDGMNVLELLVACCLVHLTCAMVGHPWRQASELWRRIRTNQITDLAGSQPPDQEVGSLLAEEPAHEDSTGLPRAGFDDLVNTCFISWALTAVANACVLICFLVMLPRGVMWPLDPSVAWKVSVHFLVRILLRFALVAFKKTLFKRILGMSDDDHDLTNQDRMEWTGEEIARLERKYGERKVKIADAVVRRANHVVSNSLKALFWKSITTNLDGAFQVAFVLWVLNCSLIMFLERRSDIVAKAFFCVARVRDGRIARLNVVSVWVWEYAGVVVTFGALVLMEPDPVRSGFFFVVAMQPVIWGDAVAELVGSFFGKHHFPVYGIGEVNQKSIEGCLGAFLANLAALMVVLSAWAPKEVIWKLPVWEVALAIAFVGMVAETVAVRSTDNAFMMLSSLAVVLMLRAEEPHWHTSDGYADWPFIQ